MKVATLEEATEAANLALLLWPDHTLEELSQVMEQLISQPDAIVLLAFYDNVAIGFAQCELRYDYVEGTHSSPVGYLEGLFVKEDFRKQGFARKLVKRCEEWAKSKGCREFASDCELGNRESLAMHLNLGFNEANRIICFKKEI